MSASDRTAFIRTAALLLAVAILALLVGPRLPAPPTAAEMRQTVARHLATIDQVRTGRADAMRAMDLFLWENPHAASALTDTQIRNIASLIVDSDQDVARRALEVLTRLGPAARPAAERVVGYIRSQPNLRFDRFAWDVELALRGSPPTIAELLKLTRAVKQSPPEQQAEMVRRIAMLADRLARDSDRVNPIVYLEPSVDAMLGMISQKGASEFTRLNAARALASFGPYAKKAIPSLEQALAAAREDERKNPLCGSCLPLANAYGWALTCISMDSETFEISDRINGRLCSFNHNPAFPP
jgi:hypothetical protein